MFSQSKKITRFHTFVATVLIIASVFFFTAPKDADAIVLIAVLATSVTVTAGLVITAIVIDGIILCAAGVICGDGGSVGSDGCYNTMGTECRSEENSCEEFNVGTIQCDGTCSVAAPSDYTGNECPSNYCGMTGGGQELCDGTCEGGTPVPDTECTDLPLPDDALVIEPPIVRTGDDIAVSWNLGLNYPTNCTIEGPGIDVTFTGPEDATGTVEGITVTGPHRYELTCGTSYRAEDVQLLPEIYDS